MDRTNIGNARLQGLEKALGLTDRTYRISLTILYVPYIILEIPSNLVIKKIGPHNFLPALVTMWGIVSTLQVRLRAQLLYNYIPRMERSRLTVVAFRGS